LQIINAPITPGTQAHSVNRKTIITEPHPLSITARGGKIIQRITRQMDIIAMKEVYPGNVLVLPGD
jgi:hypothetical protein